MNVSICISLGDELSIRPAVSFDGCRVDQLGSGN